MIASEGSFPVVEARGREGAARSLGSKVTVGHGSQCLRVPFSPSATLVSKEGRTATSGPPRGELNRQHEACLVLSCLSTTWHRDMSMPLMTVTGEIAVIHRLLNSRAAIVCDILHLQLHCWRNPLRRYEKTRPSLSNGGAPVCVIVFQGGFLGGRAGCACAWLQLGATLCETQTHKDRRTLGRQARQGKGKARQEKGSKSEQESEAPLPFSIVLSSTPLG